MIDKDKAWDYVERLFSSASNEVQVDNCFIFVFLFKDTEKPVLA